MRNVLWPLLTFFFFIVLTLGFGLPQKMVLVQREGDSSAKILISDDLVPDLGQALEENAPELILLGNSILGEAVNQQQVEHSLGLSTAKVWLGGAGSAWWYLVVKNIVPGLSPKPKYIGIFFRDNYLTLPQHKTAGKHKPGIDAIAGQQEELLDQLAYFNSMNRIELVLQQYVPLFNQREQIRVRFDKELKRITADICDKKSRHSVNKLLEQSFDNRKMNPQMLHERQLADEQAQDAYRADMRFHPDKSFLGPIVTMCKEQGIQLFFVRMKRVRDLQPGRQSRDLKRYVSKLKQYLEKERIPFIDYTGNQAVRKSHYGRGDHLNREEGREMFTALLTQDIKTVVLGQPIQ